VAWRKACNLPQSVEGVPAGMERCSNGEQTAWTASAGGFYARAAVETPYWGGGALEQGTSRPAIGATSDRGVLGQATRRLNGWARARVAFDSAPRGGGAWDGCLME
jgi:hypothetical protein